MSVPPPAANSVSQDGMPRPRPSRTSRSTSRGQEGALIIERTVGGTVKAVDGVSFSIPAGKTLGLVGESGSGKSTTGYCILPSLDQARRPAPSGVDGKELTQMSGEQLRKRSAQDMQIVFQDPYSSLDPRMTVGNIVSEPLEVARHGHPQEPARDRATAARGRGLQPELHEPLPARVLGRPAPAHRHRARSRPQPEADRVRRARLGPRRLHPGPDPQPAEGPPAGLASRPTSSSRTIWRRGRWRTRSRS